MKDNPEYLYHYTSIESLAMILSSKCIRYTSLNQVDDVIDLIHLESLSCLKFNAFVKHDKSNLYKNGDYVFCLDNIRDPELRESIITNCDKGLQHIDLTTVGLIIGISVSDIFTNKNTLFEDFEGFQ